MGGVAYTWTSGISFPTTEDEGQSINWFSFISPFNGNLSKIKIALGTSSNEQRNIYLAIGSDLKTTSNFTSSDFIAISNSTINAEEITFADPTLAGGATYYCYFVTQSGEGYVSATQSVYLATLETQQKGRNQMAVGNIGDLATPTTQAIPFEGTMAINTSDDIIYRIKGYDPNTNDIERLICSKETDGFLYKEKNVSTFDAVTNSRFRWTISTADSDAGILLKNNNGYYIPKFTASSDRGNGRDENQLKFLTTENISDAAVFTPMDGIGVESSGGRMGEVALRSPYNDEGGVSFLCTWTNGNDYVGCHYGPAKNENFAGNNFFFMQLKKVAFKDKETRESKYISIDGSEEKISEIYVAVNGSDAFTLPADYLYSFNDNLPLTSTDAVAAINAAGSTDIEVMIEDNPNLTDYTLVWNGQEIYKVENVAVNPGDPASNFVPAEWLIDCVTLTCEPEIVGKENITVTATWIGPFEISTIEAPKWYTIGIHTADEGDNWLIKDNGNNALTSQSVQKNAYELLADEHLFCFVGNPFEGINIYSKSGKYIFVAATTPNTDASLVEEAYMSNFVLASSSRSGKTFANGYACFNLKGTDMYINRNNANNKIINWGDNDNGSTCWFIPAGQYYLKAIDGIGIDVPKGAVGSSIYASSLEEGERSELAAWVTQAKSALEGEEYNGDITTLSKYNEKFSLIKNDGIVPLEAGYYRIVSANPKFVQEQQLTPAMYYKSASEELRWKNTALTTEPINSLVKLISSGSGYKIYSPNAEKYLNPTSTAKGGSRSALNAEDGKVFAFNPLGLAQYEIKADGDEYAIHTKEHNEGAGIEYNLVGWNVDGGNLNSASAWYIVKAEEVTVALNEINGTRYATLYTPFAYTVEGATAYTLTLNEQRTSLLLYEVKGYVPAGTAVVLISEQNATATLALAPEYDNEDALPTDLTGTYTAQAIPAGAQSSNYFLGKLSDVPGFYKYSGESLNLAANRAYLNMGSENASNGFSLTLSDDDITAIIDAVSSANGAPHYYDLQGRRVAAPQKGRIYIVNGKKAIF